MTESVVTFPDDFGEEVHYKRYAARLPDFLAAYPPSAGYRVEIERTDLLSLQKGLIALLREAIIAGKKPSDVGIPGIESIVNVLVCTAKLLDSQGRVVRNASAARNIADQGDFEILETAANQRLIAAVGFGGEVFSRDEDADLKARGRDVHSATPSSPLSDERQRSASAQPSAPTAALASVGEDPQNEAVTAAERLQIENLARRAGEAVPALRTRADVKAARQQLSAQARERRAANSRPLNATT